MIELFLSNNRIAVFLAQKKKSNHSIHVKGFSITRCSKIFSIRSDSYNILAGNILSTQTWTVELLTRGLLRNVGYNYNSTQYQNVFQPPARDLSGISSVNITSPLNQFHSSRLYLEERIEPYSSKLLIPTIRGSPYYHTSSKI